MSKSTAEKIIDHFVREHGFILNETDEDEKMYIMSNDDGSNTIVFQQLDRFLLFFCMFPEIQGLDLQDDQACELINAINGESAMIRFYSSEDGVLHGVAVYPDKFDSKIFDQWYGLWQNDQEKILGAVNNFLEDNGD